MKYILSIFFILFTNLAFCQSYKLDIVVTDINKVKGKIVFGIFNSENDFLIEGKEFIASDKAITDTILYNSFNLPKGKYAISIYHDENLDNKCNLNFIGIPTEAYGFSNNIKPTLKAPAFEKCSFVLDKDTQIKIHLIK